MGSPDLSHRDRSEPLSRPCGLKNSKWEEPLWNFLSPPCSSASRWGGQYALIAIGYTMVYGILRLINFAHGDVFMVAGLLGIYLSGFLSAYLPPPPSSPSACCWFWR